ncbi:MAG TPA: hypothetical protein VMH00_02030 [Candidatus Limnocylindrales bacterium]|nr:hypothetical protein [Candidatus Limnocylindrales bacterium]
MSNQAYLSIWCKQFDEAHQLQQFGAFLATVPFSTSRPGFTRLVIRAIDAAESPVLEQDLRSVPLDPAGVLEIAQDHLHADCAYEVEACWDLWVFDTNSAKPKLEPQGLEVYAYGEDYDDGFWRENGHIEVSLGFEHLFTGHAGLLGLHRAAKAAAESPEEARFLEAMAWPENLQAYQEKTRENVRKLLDWTRRIEKAVAVDHIRLWSEGEENFEARLDEILAAR